MTESPDPERNGHSRYKNLSAGFVVVLLTFGCADSIVEDSTVREADEVEQVVTLPRELTAETDLSESQATSPARQDPDVAVRGQTSDPIAELHLSLERTYWGVFLQADATAKVTGKTSKAPIAVGKLEVWLKFNCPANTEHVEKTNTARVTVDYYGGGVPCSSSVSAEACATDDQYGHWCTQTDV